MTHHDYTPPKMPTLDFTELYARANEPRTFPAGWPGECADCLTEFDQGDPIGYDADDDICCEDCLRRNAGLT